VYNQQKPPVSPEPRTVDAIFCDGQFVRNYTPLEQWQANFLRRLVGDPQKMEYLFGVLKQVREMNESHDPTKGLCSLLGRQITDPSPAIDMHRADLWAVTKLIADINELNSLFDCLDASSDYRDEVVTMENKLGREVRGE
jgi:hypothetical protein